MTPYSDNSFQIVSDFKKADSLLFFFVFSFSLMLTCMPRLRIPVALTADNDPVKNPVPLPAIMGYWKALHGIKNDATSSYVAEQLNHQWSSATIDRWYVWKNNLS